MTQLRARTHGLSNVTREEQKETAIFNPNSSEMLPRARPTIPEPFKALCSGFSPTEVCRRAPAPIYQAALDLMIL
eukprot:51818-Hanusia_phi.AAC.1